MKVQAINNNYKFNNTNFGAKVLKENVVLTNKETGKPIRADIIELETETRELTADLRKKHINDIPKEEFNRRVSGIYTDTFKAVVQRQVSHDLLKAQPLHYETGLDMMEEARRQEWEAKVLSELHPSVTEKDNTSAVQIMDELVWDSGEKRYLGDYEFMDRLTRTNNRDVIEINKRVQARKNMAADKMTPMSDYLNDLTEGKRKVMPKGGYGLLDRSLGDYLTYSEHSPIDSFIYDDGVKGTSRMRQRVLMAIEPQADYRNISPYAKVHAVAEIFTDRAMDAVEDMTSDEAKTMPEIIKADKEYDKLFKQYVDGGRTDKALWDRAEALASEICRKYNISYADFHYIGGRGKKYIKTDEEIYKAKLAEMGLTEQKVIPVIINKFFSLNKNVEGAQNALMAAIKEKGVFRGVFSEKFGGAQGFCKNLRFIYA